LRHEGAVRTKTDLTGKLATSSHARSTRRVAAALFALIVGSISPYATAANWADPAKVLRIAFPGSDGERVAVV